MGLTKISWSNVSQKVHSQFTRFWPRLHQDILIKVVSEWVIQISVARNIPDCFHWKFVVREKNYSPDCMAGEDEGKSGYFQCTVHLLVDKWNWHKRFFNLCIRGILMIANDLYDCSRGCFHKKYIGWSGVCSLCIRFTILDRMGENNQEIQVFIISYTCTSLKFLKVHKFPSFFFIMFLLFYYVDYSMTTVNQMQSNSLYFLTDKLSFKDHETYRLFIPILQWLIHHKSAT